MASIIPILPKTIQKFIGVNDDADNKQTAIDTKKTKSLEEEIQNIFSQFDLYLNLLLSNQKLPKNGNETKIEAIETDFDDFDDFDEFDDFTESDKIKPQNDLDLNLNAISANDKNQIRLFAAKLRKKLSDFSNLAKNEGQTRKFEKWEREVIRIDVLLENCEIAEKAKKVGEKTKVSKDENLGEREKNENKRLDLDFCLFAKDRSCGHKKLLVSDYLSEYFGLSGRKIEALKEREITEDFTQKSTTNGLRRRLVENVNADIQKQQEEQNREIKTRTYKADYEDKLQEELTRDLNEMADFLKRTAKGYGVTLKQDILKIDRIGETAILGSEKAKNMNDSFKRMPKLRKFYASFVAYLVLVLVFVMMYGVIKLFPKNK